MQIIKFEPKDIYVTVEFSLKQVEMLLDVCDTIDIIVDKDKPKPEFEKAVEYFKSVFKELDSFVSSIKRVEANGS